jgi:peptidoglycan/LPS O-acetylase OafA/YrhL
MNESVNKKVYFRGLDAYRGIAALLVILSHTELIKKVKNFSHYVDNGLFIFHLGGHAVTFFFVLSGFLITYLILIEEKVNLVIDIKAFYMRRILRIWPVYFVMIFIGFFFFQYINTSFLPIDIPKVPDDKYGISLFYYLVFLPHVAPNSNPIAFQAWSIGVEEIFYLFWPLIFFFIKGERTRLYALIFIYIVLPLLKLSPFFFPNIEVLNSLKFFFVKARFEDMALGGILALLLFKKYIPKHFVLQLVLVVILLLFLILELKLPFSFESVLYPLLFGNLILFTIAHSLEKGILENPIFKFLGKISYGLYMYHVLAIYITANLFTSTFKDDSIQSKLFVHFIVVMLSILISYISYNFMEKPVLALKRKYSKLEQAIK